MKPPRQGLRPRSSCTAWPALPAGARGRAGSTRWWSRPPRWVSRATRRPATPRYVPWPGASPFGGLAPRPARCSTRA
eukprot:11221674-Lingulodinium_polyedra.AAC.1